MSAFCVESIAVDGGLRPEHGILRQASLSVTTDARVAAERILQQARDEAEVLIEQARAEIERTTQEAEQKVLQRAEALLSSLGQANETFLARAQDMVVDIALGLFDRLVADATPRERVEAMLKRIQREAPPKLAGAVLRVHPDDLESLPELEWEVKADASIEPGVCRLEAGNGEWCADFSAAISALKAALTKAIEE